MFVCAECGASQQMPGHCTADGTQMQPVGDDMLLGQVIGPYRIARLLGIGGMGRVYKGVHPQIGSRVAIKVLSRECSDRRDLVERFFSEAKAVNLIRHESIVNVLDLSTLPDGRPYIVMEYLDGSPLSAIIEDAARNRMRLPIGGVARLAAEVLDALGAAHAKGIVHRDLKPDNIFVTPAGRAKVLDFGIAKLQPELGGSATHTGSLLGTPHYMSPEQAAGRSVDSRADIYAIGVILFECLTLQRPFSADALFDLLKQHIEAPPPSPRALRPDLPPAVEQVIYTALAKPPEHRFASAHAMSMALQQATAQLPPEEWTALATGRNITGGGWQHTPPASWAGSGPRSAPDAGSGVNRSSYAVAPTQTAGQVGSPPRTSSKKGVWIGLGAVLLVGGGITALVVASRSGGDAGAGSGSQVVVETAPTPIVTPGSGSDPDDELDGDGSDEEAAQAPTPAPAHHRGGAAGGEDDAAIEAMLANLFDQMTPAQRKLLPKEVQALLKKYGSWANVPKAERDKLDPETLLEQMGTAMSGLDDALAVNPTPAHSKTATTPNTPSTPPKTPNTPSTTPPSTTPTTSSLAGDPPEPPRGVAKGLDADGWVISRNFDAPSWFNPTKVDSVKAQAWALAEAKRLIPDAVLFRIDAKGVLPDGRADFTLVDSGSLDYRFISPSRSKRDPSKPLGAKQEVKCMFRVELSKDGAWSAPMDGWECNKETPLGPPKCSFAQVWKKALAKKAPSNALGELGYRAASGVARWYFDVKDDAAGVNFSEMFNDDC